MKIGLNSSSLQIFYESRFLSRLNPGIIPFLFGMKFYIFSLISLKGVLSLLNTNESVSRFRWK